MMAHLLHCFKVQQSMSKGRFAECSFSHLIVAACIGMSVYIEPWQPSNYPSSNLNVMCAMSAMIINNQTRSTLNNNRMYRTWTEPNIVQLEVTNQWYIRSAMLAMSYAVTIHGPEISKGKYNIKQPRSLQRAWRCLNSVSMFKWALLHAEFIPQREHYSS